MLALINANVMKPPISPIGIDYIASAARAAGIETEVVDLCLAEDSEKSLREYFARREPELVGISFRNVDDCFWPSGEWFVPALSDIVGLIRDLSDAAIVIGGVGFSILPEQIVDYTGADFGIRGDGEKAMISLLSELRSRSRYEKVAGLVWRENGRVQSKGAAWPDRLTLPTQRVAVDNSEYFRRGGQCGLETKRGCNRKCIYCVDRLAKGSRLRLREAAEVADEAEALLAQGVDVLHLCDSEFNVPGGHALAVCEEFIRRGLGEKLRWYTYMAVQPFDAELAGAMRAAGCVGIDFTGDSASPVMLRNYRQEHTAEDLGAAVRLCRDNGIKVMVDLLLGGPGETPETLRETINYVKKIGPDCVGGPWSSDLSRSCDGRFC